MLTMLHIVETLTPYGEVPVKLLRLTERLDPVMGRLVFAVFQPAPLDEVVRKAGAKVFEIGSISPLRIVKLLDRAIQKEAPNVVCSHHTRGLFTGYVAARLLWLVHDPDEAERMGMQAQLHASQHFNSSRFVSGYLAALQPARTALPV